MNTTLSSSSQAGIQALISVAETDACNERYLFSETKTKVLVAQKKKTQLSKEVILNGAPVKLSDDEVHLGFNQ